MGIRPLILCTGKPAGVGREGSPQAGSGDGGWESYPRQEAALAKTLRRM
ncbi:MAG: hypothetical protein LBR77_08770 [Lachnospiraceae bacterium]|nr:hypothetical protein [Lachnospiraceae bacterium]